MADNNVNDPVAVFEAMQKDVSRVFIILLGITLFFFFLVLVPYFSLRYDSRDISDEQSILSNLSKIISSVDRTINESNIIQSKYNSIIAESHNALVRTDDYSKQLQKIVALRNNVNLTPDSTAMQSILTRIELAPNCINMTFATPNWTRCNNDAEFIDETRNMNRTARDAVSQMQVSANEINKTVTEMINAVNNTSSRAKIFKDSFSNEVSLGTPTIFVDMEPIFDKAELLLKDYGSRIEPLLGNESTVLKLVCPTLYCTAIAIHNPTGFTDTTSVLQIRKDLEGIRDELAEKEAEINDRIQKISSMFENLDTPVGTIPIGFQELLALFPFIISILFLFFTYSLIQMMEIRGLIKDNDYTSTNRSSIAGLLFDPTKKQEKTGQKVQIVLLLIPVSIFISSFIINLLIYYQYDQSSLASDDPFKAAVGLNKLIYLMTSIFGAIFISISLWKLFRFAKGKPNNQKKPDTTSRAPFRK